MSVWMTPSLAPLSPTAPPPVLLLTVAPPGAVPRGPVAALASGLAGLALLGAAASLGLADEVPGGVVNGQVALKLFAHKLCLVLSAITALGGLVLAPLGWSRARTISAGALAASLAWIALFAWARFVNG